MSASDKDYIGFDPIVWIERLIDVNRMSQFDALAKELIDRRLSELRIEIRIHAQVQQAVQAKPY